MSSFINTDQNLSKAAQQLKLSTKDLRAYVVDVTKDSIHFPQDQLLSLFRNEAQGFVVLDNSTHNFTAITNVTQPEDMEDKLKFVLGQVGQSLSNPTSVQINISDLKKVVAVPFAESKAKALGLRYFNYSTHREYNSPKPFICPQKENGATALIK